MTARTSISTSTAAPDLPEPTAAQGAVLERIAAQRERLRARRAARAQAVALARQEASGHPHDSLAWRALGFAREHPAAVAAMAGVAMVAGPRRLIRWAGVVLPIVMRLKR